MSKSDSFTIEKFPRVVRIEPASACNLSCSHCPTGTYPMKRGLMTEVTFNHIIKDIYKHKDSIEVIVLYHGGEPLLNKKFTWMVQVIRKHFGNKLLIKTVTNGMLLNEAAAEKLVRSGLDSIEISLDGLNPGQNDLIRRGCRYNTVVNNIKKLIKIKNVNNSTKPEIYIASTQFYDPSKHKNTDEPAVPKYLLNEFSGDYKSEISGYKCTWAMKWPRMIVSSDLYEIYSETLNVKSNFCDHVENTITIRSNGDVVPCCYDLTSEYVVGSIMDSSLANIWNNERYLELRKSIKEGNFYNMCSNCAEVTDVNYLVLKQV